MYLWGSLQKDDSLCRLAFQYMKDGFTEAMMSEEFLQLPLRVILKLLADDLVKVERLLVYVIKYQRLLPPLFCMCNTLLS